MAVDCSRDETPTGSRADTALKLMYLSMGEDH
jgi:hypothetical protein